MPGVYRSPPTVVLGNFYRSGVFYLFLFDSVLPWSVLLPFYLVFSPSESWRPRSLQVFLGSGPPPTCTCWVPTWATPPLTTTLYVLVFYHRCIPGTAQNLFYLCFTFSLHYVSGYLGGHLISDLIPEPFPVLLVFRFPVLLFWVFRPGITYCSTVLHHGLLPTWSWSGLPFLFYVPGHFPAFWDLYTYILLFWVMRYLLLPFPGVLFYVGSGPASGVLPFCLLPASGCSCHYVSSFTPSVLFCSVLTTYSIQCAYHHFLFYRFPDFISTVPFITDLYRPVEIR